MYSRKEALLSSQIEGTQASFVDVLEQEADPGRVPRRDVQEVLNHQAAMSYGLERLEELPLSTRLLREMHPILMRGVRGGRRRVGDFRRTQNWIGPPGSRIQEATFVPPDVPSMQRAMGDLASSPDEPKMDRDFPSPDAARMALPLRNFRGNGDPSRIPAPLPLRPPLRASHELVPGAVAQD